jgi:ubiquinone/menaquinone biosynthesis C-methylase UbiE
MKPLLHEQSRRFVWAGAIFLLLLFRISLGQEAEHNSAEAFDKIARTTLKNAYPYLALQIKQDYGITRGLCVEAGAGGAYLSIELAKITELKFQALDIDPAAIRIAQRNIRNAGLTQRIEAVLGDVQKMPFPDHSADLVISRGSFLFWKDKVKAFGEIWRILKPGGVAFIGGGVGKLLPPDEKEIIKEKMTKGEFGPPKNLWIDLEDMSKILREAGISQFEVTSDDACICGMWVEFKKPVASVKK